MHYELCIMLYELPIWRMRRSKSRAPPFSPKIFPSRRVRLLVTVYGEAPTRTAISDGWKRILMSIQMWTSRSVSVSLRFSACTKPC